MSSYAWWSAASGSARPPEPPVGSRTTPPSRRSRRRGQSQGSRGGSPRTADRSKPVASGRRRSLHAAPSVCDGPPAQHQIAAVRRQLRRAVVRVRRRLGRAADAHRVREHSRPSRRTRRGRRRRCRGRPRVWKTRRALVSWQSTFTDSHATSIEPASVQPSGTGTPATAPRITAFDGSPDQSAQPERAIASAAVAAARAGLNAEPPVACSPHAALPSRRARSVRPQLSPRDSRSSR